MHLRGTTLGEKTGGDIAGGAALMPGAVPIDDDAAATPRRMRANSMQRRSTIYAAQSFTISELEEKIATAEELCLLHFTILLRTDRFSVEAVKCSHC